MTLSLTIPTRPSATGPLTSARSGLRVLPATTHNWPGAVGDGPTAIDQWQLETRNVTSGFQILGSGLLTAWLLWPGAALWAQWPPADEFNPEAGNWVNALAVQPDGKILVGGAFSTLAGQTRSRLGRLNPDGSLDSSFSAEADGVVGGLAVQPDGKVVVGGSFTNLAGQGLAYLARLNPDGTVDSGFAPQPNGTVQALALQPDGKLVVGGAFTSLAGQPRLRLGRLNPDGSLDSGFGPGADGPVNCLAVQADGRILVGGSFTNLGGYSRARLGRLEADGSVEEGFDPGASGPVHCLGVQADGRIVVGGAFTSLAGQPRTRLGRLNPDGSLDSSFNVSANNWVMTVGLQTDGGIIVGGHFTSLAGTTRHYLGRLTADGTVDLGFSAGADGWVYAVGLQPDGKVLVGGAFSTLAGVSRSRLGRLHAPGAATQSLGWEGSTITWVRAGSSPELSWSVLELLGEDVSWQLVGPGQRIPGGWRWDQIGLPAGSNLRVAGYVAGGYRNGSGWCEAQYLWGRPVVVGQPVSLTNQAGSLATLGVRVVGAQPISFRWFKDGVAVTDGGKVSGALSSTLTLSNLLGGDAGNYWVVVSNTWGSATSAVARLRVVGDPFIAVQPVSQTRDPGQSVSLVVVAAGSEPVAYQWFKDGIPLVDGGRVAGATRPALTVTNLFPADAGDYWVVISNEYGSATSAVARLTLTPDPVISTQPTGLTGQVGQTMSLRVVAGRTEPLAYQWFKDGIVLADGGRVSGATAPELRVWDVQLADAGRYWVVVSNLYGSVTSAVAVVTVNAATVDLGFSLGTDRDVYAVAVQPDGKVVVGGTFGRVAGQGRSRLARLNADGSLDEGFNPGANDTVWCLAVQPDGKVLVGGAFTNLAGQRRLRLGRLNPDGSLDSTFDPGAGDTVQCLAVQADGKIVVGGRFTWLGGKECNYLGRLNPDGTLDPRFSLGASYHVYTVAVQPDGKLVVGGYFSWLAGNERSFIGRLNADGTLDTSFNPGADGPVNCLAVQPDGKILVGGRFTTLAGQLRPRLARLNPSGSLDTEFSAWADQQILCLSLQTDGQIVVAGPFTTLTGQPRRYLGRLNADGSLDQAFLPEPDAGVYALALQPDGKVLVGGAFTTLAGTGRDRLGRLNNPTPATQRLDWEGSTISWLRSGSSPEVSWVVFQGSADRTNWVPLGYGSRIAGGWRLTDTPVGSAPWLQGLGYAAGGYFNGSSGLAAAWWGRPLLLVQPASQTNQAATTATFSVVAEGTPPMSFQWFKDHVALVDGPKVAGANRATLTLSNLLGGDAGSYWVVVSNSFGTATSALARLTVVGDPWITVQPVGQTRNPGQSVSFSVAAAGSEPLSYQWFKDGVPLVDGGRISGATTPVLTVTNLFPADAGDYRVVVSNLYSSVTSAGARLTLNPDPVITSHPVNWTGDLGQSASFSVVVVGTEPLSYQWFKDGVPLVDDGRISGATTAVLTLSHLRSADAGNYRVVVSNLYSSVTSAVARLTVPQDPILTVQPSSQTRQVGQGVSFTAGAAGTEPLGYQWFKDGVALADGHRVSGATSAMVTVTNLFQTDAGRYWVVVSNGYGSVTSAVAVLTINAATLDLGFDPKPADVVSAIALQRDGKILLGGLFTNLGGQSRLRIGRLMPDGTVDATFDPDANLGVNCLALDSEGRVLVGGSFNTLAGQPIAGLARLMPDGTLDWSFNPGATSSVDCLAIDLEGKILVGGSFAYLGGRRVSGLDRLMPDGRPDPTFDPPVFDSLARVHCVAVQPDGKILVGGSFVRVAGQARSRVARLNPDGTLDPSFNPGANGRVFSLALQADGKIVVGGDFTMLGGLSRSNIGRLNPDGSVDLAFAPQASARVHSLAIQSDGEILVAGTFTNLGGLARTRIGRLKPDGSVDPNFDPGVTGPVYSIALQSDGKVLLGGLFTNVAGQARRYLARLNNTGPATESLTVEGSTLTWLRGGTGPELWRATFELSTNRIAWLPLGEGRRIPGGWQLTGIAIPANASVRARGYTTGGQYNGCAWFVEAGAGPPWMVHQPASRTNQIGSVAPFHAWAQGTGPLSYQWFKDGAPLAEAGKVAGASTPTLTLSNVAGSEIGAYWVVVSSPLGSLTSAVAHLTVLDPWITSHPQSAESSLGQTVTLSVAAAGTPPLTYQWYHDGTPVSGATEPSLTLTNLLPADVGRYWVVVSNPYWSATSRVATVTMNAALADPDFDPDADAPVLAMAVQPDGKIVMGGGFTAVAGQSRSRIARLNSDGTLDPQFDPGADGLVLCVLLQPDSKIVVGGSFTTLAGQSCAGLGRLNPDGTLDASFNVQAEGSVHSIALQPDGRIVVGGSFTKLAGQPRLRLGRINSDGTLDPTFSPSADHYVSCVALQPDGKILVGGDFSSLAGRSRPVLGRLNPDGTLDASFNPGADKWVSSIVVQPDGKILVGGGVAYFVRLHSDGTLDPTFNAGIQHVSGGCWVSGLALQADGKILVGGYFTSLAGRQRLYLGRVEPDGTPDPTFNPGASPYVRSFALQPDGAVLVGGNFTNLAGAARRYMGRLNQTEPATESLTVEGSTLTWLRGGTGPEVWRTTFEVSTNGVDWVSLGQGRRIPGGWQLTGVALPPAATIRARGWVRAAYHTSSEWFVESLATVGPPFRLSIRRDGAQLRLSWTGGRGPYQVQQNPDLNDPNGWTDLGEPLNTNSITLPIGSGNLFLRVKGQ